MSERDRPDAELLRAAFELAPIGVVVAELDGTISWPNPAFCAIVGYTRDELIGSQATRLAHPEDRLIEQARMQELLGGARTSYQIRKRFVHADGRTVHTLQTVHRVPQGDRSRIIAHILDITDQVEREVEAATHERMRTVGRLAGSIAHDFNNLLTAIQTNSAMIAESVTDPDVTEMIADVLAASETGARLTDRLLGFSRGAVTRSEVLDLAALVHDRLPALRSLVPGTRVEVDAPDAAFVFGDGQQLEQVLLNLVANARAACRISIQVAVRWDEIHLVVADDGPGMPESVRSRAFEPYFTTRRGEGGTGLGLTMVYGSVANHDGQIAIESEVGRGTQVTIRLPQVEAPSGERGERVVDESVGLDPSSVQLVLVIDDDGPVRRAVRRAIRAPGRDVVEADGALSARRLFARHKHRLSLVIVDIVLRDANGHELATEIRAERPGIPILYMSGYDDGDLEPYASEPIRPLLRKPFTADEILAAVGACLTESSRPAE